MTKVRPLAKKIVTTDASMKRRTGFLQLGVSGIRDELFQ